MLNLSPAFNITGVVSSCCKRSALFVKWPWRLRHILLPLCGWRDWPENWKRDRLYVYTFNVTSILLYTVCIHSDVHNDNQVRIVQPLALFEIMLTGKQKREKYFLWFFAIYHLRRGLTPRACGEDEGHVHPNALQRSSSEASRQPRCDAYPLFLFALRVTTKKWLGKSPSVSSVLGEMGLV